MLVVSDAREVFDEVSLCDYGMHFQQRWEDLPVRAVFYLLPFDVSFILSLTFFVLFLLAGL